MKLTPEQQEFNQLHVKYIAEDKRFREWGNLSLFVKAEIIDEAEKLAEAEFLKSKQIKNNDK